jgi:hypothetical protein
VDEVLARKLDADLAGLDLVLAAVAYGLQLLVPGLGDECLRALGTLHHLFQVLRDHRDQLSRCVQQLLQCECITDLLVSEMVI